MPKQEIFLELTSDNSRIEVVKSYDTAYAREVFEMMDDSAQAELWSKLAIAKSYESKDLPPAHAAEWTDFLWAELLDDAREDGNLLSFFVVTERRGPSSRDLFVSADWQSAESFARRRVAEDHL